MTLEYRAVPRLTVPFLLRLCLVVLSAAITVTLLFAWFAGDFSAAHMLKRFSVVLVYSFSIGMIAGITMPFLGPRLLRMKSPFNWVLVLGAMLTMVAVGSLMAGFILASLRPPSVIGYWAEFRRAFGMSAVATLVFGTSTFLYEMVRSKLEETSLLLKEKELAEERARRALIQARLSSLESRIHPHFLFNTLNSVAALIPDDPTRAEDTVTRMAALLRFALDAGSQSMVNLSDELKIVTDYLEIEKTRLENRLTWLIDVPDGLESCQVPPLAIQCLVENSVKHAIALRPSGGIVRLRARLAHDILHVEVEDDGPGLELGQIAVGHGLDSLRARLEALFAGTARLEVHRRHDCTVVELSLPQRSPIPTGLT